jgi:hypothetical protein
MGSGGASVGYLGLGAGEDVFDGRTSDRPLHFQPTGTHRLFQAIAGIEVTDAVLVVHRLLGG